MPRSANIKPRHVGRRIKAWRLRDGLSQRDEPMGTTGLALLTSDEDAHCPFCQRG